MVRSNIAFQCSADGRLLATLHWVDADDFADSFTVSSFVDENDLLQGIALAGLSDDTTVDLISKVLLTVTGRPYEGAWVSVHASLAQYGIIGLELPSEIRPTGDVPGFLSSVDLRAALEQTPVPLCLLEGPELIVTFINDGYMRLLGRQNQSQLIGKRIREALQDLEGQPFFGWLDQTYRTGEPYVGYEVPGRLFSYRTQQTEDVYWDFVYHAVRNNTGQVCGILAQAADVTDRMLDKHVREAREQQLYQQWAELDTLYRCSTLGMALLRASDLVILRLNDNQAALLGGNADDLVGRRIEDFYPREQYVGDVLRRVVRDRTPCTLEFTAGAPSAPERLRKWTWNLNPILDAVGEVESIASVVLEVTQPLADPGGFLDKKD